MLRSLLIVLALVASSLGVAHAGIPGNSQQAVGPCKELAAANVQEIIDAPTQITNVRSVDARDGAPAYCEVTAYVAPAVGIKMGLPSPWNGKFMMRGCGAHCGLLTDDYLVSSCNDAMRKGYACLVSDMGHTGMVLDGLWAYGNLQGKVDWGFRSTHVATLAGKAITEHYYAQPPKKSYFMGCSTGGRQALVEAQRFPWDYDGIVAGSPPVDVSMIYMTFAWGIRATHDANGQPMFSSDELKLLTSAAVAQCDADDGIKDGIIGDAMHCPFDPGVLACKAGKNATCLSAAQVEAARKVYAGPLSSNGAKLSLGGPLPGSEAGPRIEERGNGWRGAFFGVEGRPGVAEGFRYIFFFPEPGPTWQLSDFDFDRDYKRLGIMESLYTAGNPDLRRFKEAGGKMIVFQGMNDISVLPRSTADYYEAVERSMGGRKTTQDFTRLFMLPGGDHCAGGHGAWAVDYLGHIEAWVEQGRAPDQLVAAQTTDAVKPSSFPQFPLDPQAIEFTRPLYPYPAKAKYLGRGDSKNASSWGPATR